MRTTVLLLALSVVLAGCSTITIDEETVFQPKPSVTPETFSVDDVDLSVRNIPVADSASVNGWHLTQADAETTVLFFGGNGFYLVQSKGYLRALTRPPVNAFLWDYRGYGRSDGAPSAANVRDDALAVYDSLVARPGVSPVRTRSRTRPWPGACTPRRRARTVGSSSWTEGATMTSTKTRRCGRRIAP